MASIKLFKNESFGEVRVAGTSDEPLFCLTDVCQALSLIPSKVVQRLNKDVLSKYPLKTIGGTQQVNFVNEDGLYDVILDSRKIEAKAFRKWITSEVLPSIRKTGGYIVTKQEDTPEEIMAKALTIAQQTLIRREERIKELQVQSELQQATINLQEKQLKESASKVAYHDKVLSSVSTYTVTQIAKEFGYGAETLNRKLREMSIQYKQNGQWLLKAKYQKKGYTKTITRQFIGSNGEIRTTQHTVWTEVGREFIHRLLDERLK